MHSCIYEGTVTHRRCQPVDHRFQYRLFMVYLDLDELPQWVGRDAVIADTWLASRAFLPHDHLFGRSPSLAREVREIIRTETGIYPNGSIRLMTQLRYFGYYFSPLNLYYVYGERRTDEIEFVVAEVSNTPWNDRHCYVLWDGNRTHATDRLRFSHGKELHVSPFMGMDMQYRWQLTSPGSHLDVQVANYQGDEQLFDARLTLERRELNAHSLRRMTLRYPVMTAQISAAIYYQAWKLWWKKCPFYPHPRQPNDSPHPATAASKRIARGPIV